MRAWVLMAYLVVLTATIATAAYLALFDPDPQRANRAYLIFKITLAAAALRIAELP